LWRRERRFTLTFLPRNQRPYSPILRKGTDYGLPVQYIQHTCRGAHALGDQKSIKTELIPLLVTGNSLAWGSDSLTVNLDHPKLRGELIKKFQYRICRHFYSHLPAIILCQIEAMLHWWREGFKVMPDVLADHKCRDLMHCSFCNMDFKVDVEAKADRRAIITVDAWYNFGDRRSNLMSIDKEEFLPYTEQSVRYHQSTRCPRNLEAAYNGSPNTDPRSRCSYSSAFEMFESLNNWYWRRVKITPGKIRAEFAEGPYMTYCFPAPKPRFPISLSVPVCPFTRPQSDISLVRKTLTLLSLKVGGTLELGRWKGTKNGVNGL
jgi:hypothetical protein